MQPDGVQALARHARAQMRFASSGEPCARPFLAEAELAVARAATGEQYAIGTAAQRIIDE